ncbi:MAG: hypothetical protein J0L57_08715 [Burkholderiales bacterium]|nr:hypothetical protein [Burkholderiales bacterium]
MNDASAADPAGVGRGAAARLFAIAALGEIGVGAAVLVFPQVLGWLVGQPLDPAGSIVARLAGCAVLALGSNWWLARDTPAARARLRPGMLVYDFGAAVVFLLAAMQTPSPVLPAIVALLHIGLGVAAAMVPPGGAGR